MIQHQKNNSYHLQDNGIVDAFNKSMERHLIDIFIVHYDDWYEIILVVLCSYCTT
jgi:hypothetical protein